MSTFQPKQVMQTLISQMYQHAWNTKASLKNRNGSYQVNFGGMLINWRQDINWNSYDINTMVNEASPSSSAVPTGQTQIQSHDPQVCLMFERARAIYKTLYPGDSQFDGPSPAGFMGVSQMITHLLVDYAPATTSSNGGYNNPKGWVYWAMLDIYLAYQNSPLLTQAQISGLQQSLLYQAFTYMNSWGDTTITMCVNEKHSNYQPSQSFLMAAAVIDATQRWPSQIQSGMFYDASPFSPQTAAGWSNFAYQSLDNTLYRGAWNPYYNYFYGVMNVNAGQPKDTINNAVAKVDDTSEDAYGLVFAYHVTGFQRYADMARACLNGIDKLTLDTTNGGYYSNFNAQTGVLNNAYKETRATGHMLYAYTLYNKYISPGYYATRVANILNTICNHFYQQAGATGVYYRTLPDATFGFFTDHYTPAFASTLAAPIAVGDTAVSVNDLPSKGSTTCSTNIPSAGTYTCFPDSMVNIAVGVALVIQDANQETVTVSATTDTSFTATFTNSHTSLPYTIQITLKDTVTIINYGGYNEELCVLSYQGVTGSGPYSIPYNSGTYSPGQFAMFHMPGEDIRTMLYPQGVGQQQEIQYTTEAMSNMAVYLGIALQNVATNQLPVMSDGSNSANTGSPTYDQGPEILQMSGRRPTLLQIFEMDIENLIAWIRDQL